MEMRDVVALGAAAVLIVAFVSWLKVRAESRRRAEADRRLRLPWSRQFVDWAVPAWGVGRNRLWSSEHVIADLFLNGPEVMLVELHRIERAFNSDKLPGLDSLRTEVPYPRAEGRFGNFSVTLRSVMWQGDMLIAVREQLRGFTGWNTQPDMFAVLERSGLLIVVSVWSKSQRACESRLLTILESLRVSSESKPDVEQAA